MSLIFLIVLALAVAAGVATATILLGNRHTRGAMQFVAVGLILLVGAIVVWSFAAVPSRVEEPVASTPYSEHQYALQENQARHFDQLAERYEHHSDPDIQQLAQEYHEKAANVRHQLSGHSSYSVTSSYRTSTWLGLFSPAILIVFLVIVFLLFKHAGPAVGFAALALPVILLFFSYSSVQRHTTQRYPQSQPSDPYVLTGSPGEIQPPMFDEGRSVDVSLLEPVAEVHPAVAEVQDAAEFATIASTSAEIEVADTTKTDQAPSDDEPAPATPVEEIPDWVRQPPKSVPNVHRQVVQSDWYGTPAECLAKLENGPIEQLVEAYIRELAIEESRRSYVSVPRLERLGITKRYIRENLIKEQFYETKDFDHQPNMKNLHVLLEYDSRTTDDLLARWRTYARQDSMEAVGMGMAGVLICLAGVLGLVKLDTYTKGYYTKRLFIGVPAAIIGIGFLIAMFN